MFVTEVPGLSADVLGGGAEHGPLDRHAPMGGVIVTGWQEPLDRQAEQDDALVVAVEVPPRHFVSRLVQRHRADLEAHVLQFGPAAAEELHRGADDEIEAVDAAVERSERRANDLAASDASVAAVTIPSAGSSSTCGATTGHVQKSTSWFGAASAGHRALGHSLTVMNARLCSKVGCAREAVATLTYDYGDQMAALGPLGLDTHPNAHDLCAPHADRLSVPAGWLVVRHEALRA